MEERGLAPVSAVDFLCECHSTPFYAYVHTRPGLLREPPFPMRFLDCTPDFEHNLSTAAVEDRVFQRDPAAFVRVRYARESRGAEPLPSHVVTFSRYRDALEPLLRADGYIQCAEYFHDLSTTLLLYCLQDDTTAHERPTDNPPDMLS